MLLLSDEPLSEEPLPVVWVAVLLLEPLPLSELLPLPLSELLLPLEPLLLRN